LQVLKQKNYKIARYSSKEVAELLKANPDYELQGAQVDAHNGTVEPVKDLAAADEAEDLEGLE